MDDEVFVTVEYRDDDFVRVRRLMLLERLRATNTGQIVVFVLLGAVGMLFLAPDPLGRIFASAGGALVGLIGLLVAIGWFRAARPMKLPIEEASIEISSSGTVVKVANGYHRLRWRDFDGVREGLGVFWWSGKTAVIVPVRCLREKQLGTLRGLVRAYGGEVRSDRGSAPAPPTEQDHQSRS